jgi:hypothetical protein
LSVCPWRMSSQENAPPILADAEDRASGYDFLGIILLPV